jgi:uncharacterized protein
VGVSDGPSFTCSAGWVGFSGRWRPGSRRAACPYNPRMVPAIESRRAQLSELCSRMRVRRLEVFGSAARGDFDPASSDIDFLVEFEPGFEGSALGTYFGLKDELEVLFSRPVDLVMPSAVRNPYVRAEIDRSRELIYAA